MAAPTVGSILRQLQHAQGGMKKARQLLARARSGDTGSPAARRVAWEALLAAYRTMASIPLDCANEQVLTRLIGVQRYATALAVRVKRLDHSSSTGTDEPEDDFDNEF